MADEVKHARENKQKRYTTSNNKQDTDQWFGNLGLLFQQTFQTCSKKYTVHSFCVYDWQPQQLISRWNFRSLRNKITFLFSIYLYVRLIRWLISHETKQTKNNRQKIKQTVKNVNKRKGWLFRMGPRFLFLFVHLFVLIF